MQHALVYFSVSLLLHSGTRFPSAHECERLCRDGGNDTSFCDGVSVVRMARGQISCFWALSLPALLKRNMPLCSRTERRTAVQHGVEVPRGWRLDVRALLMQKLLLPDVTEEGLTGSASSTNTSRFWFLRVRSGRFCNKTESTRFCFSSSFSTNNKCLLSAAATVNILHLVFIVTGFWLLFVYFLYFSRINHFPSIQIKILQPNILVIPST